MQKVRAGTKLEEGKEGQVQSFQYDSLNPASLAKSFILTLSHKYSLRENDRIKAIE